ncbi:MAG TPA: capsular polysaccharide synthesis protein [Stellaceae bacterium]|nr:capsular polysaccharide synthesis protein [Stellaceae bacterium]
MSRVIWQYWETVGEKPAFIDGLREIARRIAGIELILVTPETLGTYLSDIPPELFSISQIAHKADMIRAMLVQRHGGMWLDSDAIVLKPLDWILDLLEAHEFVCFTQGGLLAKGGPLVRVNCFASRPGGRVISEWVRKQHATFPRTTYNWEEIGSETLHPICLRYKNRVKTLPFETIAPIPWQQVSSFGSRDSNAAEILEKSYIVMLTNSQLQSGAPWLRQLTTDQIASGDYLLATIMRHAMREAALHEPSPSIWTADRRLVNLAKRDGAIGLASGAKTRGAAALDRAREVLGLGAIGSLLPSLRRIFDGDSRAAKNQRRGRQIE